MLSTMFMPSPLTLVDHVMHDLMTIDAPRGIALSRDAPRLVEKDERTYALTVSAPGVARENLKCTIEGNALKVVGETSSKTHTHFVNWSTSLPRNADGYHATAEMADGILTLTIPKKAPEEMAPTTRMIAVNATPTDDADTSDEETDDDAYSLTLRAPGIAASDLSITLEGTALKIAGETKRTGMRIDRVYKVPRDVDASGKGLTASHVDGVLAIRLPKKAAPVPMTIPFVSAGGEVANTVEEHAPNAAAALAPAPASEEAATDKEDVVMV